MKRVANRSNLVVRGVGLFAIALVTTSFVPRASADTCTTNCGSEKSQSWGWSTLYTGKKKCYETLPQVGLFDDTQPTDGTTPTSGETSPGSGTKTTGSGGVR